MAAAQSAIEAIERAEHEMAEGRADADLYIAAASRIMDLYRERIDRRQGTSRRDRVGADA